MIKNNNPGNLRYSPANNWVGQIGQDYRGFVIFDSLYNGTRAMIKLILNYIAQGYDTPEKIIYRYAPTNENDTAHYLYMVSIWSGLTYNERIDPKDDVAVVKLISAMIRMETSETISPTMVLTAYNALIDGVIIDTPGEPGTNKFTFASLLIGGIIISQIK